MSVSEMTLSSQATDTFFLSGCS